MEFVDEIEKGVIDDKCETNGDFVLFTFHVSLLKFAVSLSTFH